MKVKLYDNLGTILENAPKDSHFLRRDNFCTFGVIKAKTLVKILVDVGLVI